LLHAPNKNKHGTINIDLRICYNPRPAFLSSMKYSCLWILLVFETTSLNDWLIADAAQLGREAAFIQSCRITIAILGEPLAPPCPATGDRRFDPAYTPPKRRNAA